MNYRLLGGMARMIGDTTVIYVKSILLFVTVVFLLVTLLGGSVELAEFGIRWLF